MSNFTPSNLFSALFGKTPKKIDQSFKELRFTRARQATHLYLVAALFGIFGVSLALSLYIHHGPNDAFFKQYISWSLLPLTISLVTLRCAIHCVRHAYLLLTPMGIEIFPFFKPHKNLQVLYWAEIHAAEISNKELTLHTNAEHSAGVVVSLKPIAPAQICLLQKAINSRTAAS